MSCLFHVLGPKPILPIDGPWRNSSLKAFIRNVDAGKEETGKKKSQIKSAWRTLFWWHSSLYFVFEAAMWTVRWTASLNWLLWWPCTLAGLRCWRKWRKSCGWPRTMTFVWRGRWLQRGKRRLSGRRSTSGHARELQKYEWREASPFVCLPNIVRFLEHFILNGSDPNALEAVLAQLNDPKRQNPQKLDRAVIGEATCVLVLFEI